MAAIAPSYSLHAAPEVSYSDAPEAVPKDQAGLEVDQKQQYGGPHHEEPVFELATDSDKINAERRILGFRPRAFWLILILALIITAATVGGGVGGSMASRKSSGADSAAVTTSPLNTTTTPPSPTDSTTTPRSPTDSITIQKGSATSTSASASASVTRGAHGCPTSNGTTYTSQYGTKFQILCDMLWSWGGNDLANPATANLELCMDQCAMWNQAYAPDSVCYLAVFGKQYTDVGYSNCWMKSVPLGGSNGTAGANNGIELDNTVASGMMLSY